MAPSASASGDSFWVRYALSCSAAAVAEMSTYPLDLTKTRLQIQGEAPHRGPKLGMLGITKQIVGNEGLPGLWRGVTPAIGRHLVYTGVRIALYEQLREHVFHKDKHGNFSMWKALASGMAAGGAGQFLASPADLLKIQLQMEGRRRAEGLPPRVHGMAHAVRQIVAKSGFLGLWRGWLPSVQRAALVNMADLATYDKVKHLLLRETSMADNWVLHAVSSVCAGFAAAICSTPMDVVKTRVMNQPLAPDGRGQLYHGTIDCFRKTVAKEGVFALYKGFVPIWTRMGPWSLMFWVSYEEIRKLCGSSSF